MKNRRLNWQIVVSGILIFAVWLGALLVYAQTKQDGKGVGVKVVSELPSKEKRWALIVGIDEYQNDVSTLKGSVNDAKALKNVLVNNAGFSDNQIILLTTDSAEQDKRPTRDNILGALSDLYSRVPEDGLLLFSFSGHGISVGNQAFLIPSNGRFTKNQELLQDFSIDVSRIKRAIETMKVKQVLMLLDACRNEPGKGDTPNVLTDAYKNGFSFDVANSDVKAFATLYATSISERAYEFFDKETKQFRGYFSHAVEEALKGKAANEKGEVTLSRLIDYLETTVPKKVKYDKGETQIPMANYSETYRANQLILAVAKKSNSDTPVVSSVNSASLRRRWEEMLKNSENRKMIIEETTAEIKRNPNNSSALRIRSYAYFINEEDERGKSDAEVALHLLKNPLTAEDYETRCHSYRRLEKYDEAIADCTRAIKLNPKFVWAYYNRGSVYGVKKDYDRAISDLSKAIEIDPKFAWSYRKRGGVRYFKENYDLAVSDFSKAIELDPKYADNYGLRGVVYHMKKDYDRAIADYTKAIELDPKTAENYALRGVIYQNKNDYYRAIVDYSKAIELNPKYIEVYKNRAEVYEKIGSKDLAEADRKKVEELEKKN